MKITGKKSWFIVVFAALLAGIMVYVPLLRYSYYDQLVILFTQYHPVVDSSYVNRFIGDFGMAYGVVVIVGYILFGILTDRFSEKWMLIWGGITMLAACVWFAFVPGKTAIIIIHVLFGIGSDLIFQPYLKLTRKMGTAGEQGRLFSISEFVRNIFGTVIGFVGVGFLGKAMLKGSLDPMILGQQWKILMLTCAGLFALFTALIWIFVPAGIVGNEQKDGEKEASFSMKNLVYAMKLPGTWMLSLLIFFCFSFTSAGNGYLGAYTVNVLGISTNTASTFAVIRNYIIAAISTLVIGFVSDKVGSKSKTMGLYLAIAGGLCLAMMFTKNNLVLCLAITFVFAAVYTGMRGIYFAAMPEVGIPLELTGMATGFICTICYLPDIFFAKLAGTWLDAYGYAGYDYIWCYTVACGVLGIIVAVITYRYSQKLHAKEIK